MTIKELAQETSVDDRTIRRDLNTLRKAGFPLEERVSEHGRKHWKLVEAGADKVLIRFNWSEAVALYLGRRLLDPLAGTHFWNSAQSAFGKIRATLGETALQHLDKVASAFVQTMPGISDYSNKADLIDCLMIAIEDHKIAWVTYQSERATEPVTLEMYPYGIIYHKGSLYLVAYSRDHEQSGKEGLAPSPRGACPSFPPPAPAPGASPSLPASTVRDKNALRHFKLDRVTAVDVQNLQFSPDPEFDLRTHLAHSFGVYRSDENPGQPHAIRIRFAPEAARYVQEKTWHLSQQIFPGEDNDGSVILEVHLDSTKEIKAWALSFGPRATILEPQSLRDEIARDLETMLDTYKASSKAENNNSNETRVKTK